MRRATSKSRCNTASPGPVVQREDSIAVVLLVMRESIEDQSEDKEYSLERLELRDKITETLNSHLEDLDADGISVTVGVIDSDDSNDDLDAAIANPLSGDTSILLNRKHP